MQNAKLYFYNFFFYPSAGGFLKNHFKKIINRITFFFHITRVFLSQTTYLARFWGANYLELLLVDTIIPSFLFRCCSGFSPFQFLSLREDKSL